ncbi:MAG: phenylacetic acid degradation protein [Chloroflexi bacterium]|nr:phenylacetic acid degradation protein [Chloroflexota bacterium]
MADTQWPRFMVFERDQPDHPWKHNGSVHAPDLEMALLNARDVFSRRPEQAGMFVVPMAAILTQTREQLAENPLVVKKLQEGQASSASSSLPYMIFAKTFEQGPCEYVAEISAESPEAALAVAIATTAVKNPLWWWAFAASTVLASDAADAESMFAPARKKSYKSSNEYPVVTMMRQIRAKGKLED